MKTIDLCGAWSGECVFSDGESFRFEASVPGSTIQDLIRANRLPKDIFWRDHADAVAKFEGCDYIYKKCFAFEGSGENAFLRFERLDTYADVFLNGEKKYHS